MRVIIIHRFSSKWACTSCDIYVQSEQSCSKSWQECFLLQPTAIFVAMWWQVHTHCS